MGSGGGGGLRRAHGGSGVGGRGGGEGGYWGSCASSHNCFLPYNGRQVRVWKIPLICSKSSAEHVINETVHRSDCIVE